MATPRVPDRPSLEGSRIVGPLAGSRTARTVSTGPWPRGRVLDRHAAADSVRLASRRSRVLLYQTDIVARYQRMTGKAVFYPIGWDDNGLPPSAASRTTSGQLRPVPALRRGLHPSAAGAQTREERTCVRYRARTSSSCATSSSLRTSRPLSGCSASSEPRSTGPSTTRRSARYRGELRQRGFLRLLARDQAYRQEAPTRVDVDFQTAVAQASWSTKRTRASTIGSAS